MFQGCLPIWGYPYFGTVSAFGQSTNDISGHYFRHIFFFLFLLCCLLFLQQECYLTKFDRSAKKLGVDTFPDPLILFWGLLAAILNFAGGVAVQMVSKCPRQHQAGSLRFWGHHLKKVLFIFGLIFIFEILIIFGFIFFFEVIFFSWVVFIFLDVITFGFIMGLKVQIIVNCLMFNYVGYIFFHQLCSND